MNLKQILGKLGGDKKEAAAPKERTRKPKRIDPKKFSVQFMRDNYTNLHYVLKNEEVVEGSDYGIKLIDFIVSNKELFIAWVGRLDTLKKLLAIRPDKKEECYQYALKYKECWGWCVEGDGTLVEFIEFYPEKRTELLDLFFSHRELYSISLCHYVLPRMLEQFPDYTETMMEIIASDIEIYNNCVMGPEDFWNIIEQHPKYKHRFYNYHITDDTAYSHLFRRQDNTLRALETLPEKQDETMQFMTSNLERFTILFSNCVIIPDFCAKAPKYRDLVCKTALSYPQYIRKNFICGGDLFEFHAGEPEYAQQVESMIIQDPEWVIKIVKFTTDLEKITELGCFERLKNAFLVQFYQNPKIFTFHVSNATELETMIAILPEQKMKLQLHYELFTLKTPLTEMLKKHYQNDEAVVTLSDCIAAGTIEPKTIKEARSVITELLATVDDNIAHKNNLVNLQSSLDAALAPKFASAIGQTISKVANESASKIDAKAQQPDQPGRTSSN